MAAAYCVSAGCDRSEATSAADHDHSVTTVTTDSIISLSPAATDLLLGMGAADRLVGVSTFDSDPRIASLPRVGDYENVDWERIVTLAPRHMIVQMAPDRLPAGFVERAKKLNVELHLSHIDRLDDITREAIEIGEKIGRPGDAKAFVEKLTAPIEAAKRAADRKPRIRTLIAVSEDGLGVAGHGTYLDDLLTAAGGENVLGSSRGGYVKLDREALLALAPDAIVHLSPASAVKRAPVTPAWNDLAGVPAAKSGRVLTIDEPWALMPGAHVGELAARISNFLHPKARG